MTTSFIAKILAKFGYHKHSPGVSHWRQMTSEDELKEDW